MPPRNRNSRERSSATSTISSDAEMMVDDAIQRIVDFGKEAEDKIERIIDRMESSAQSFGSRSSQVSQPSNEDEQAIKYQRKLAEEFRKYIDQTAVRAVTILRQVASPKTLMVKSYVQQILALQNENPHQFVASIADPDVPLEEYMQFTLNDQMGFYLLSHFFLYATYIQPLQAAGAQKDYWNHMAREILNSIISTPLMQNFFDFAARHKDHLETIGFTVDDMVNGVRVKFLTELNSLFDIMVALPVKLSIAGQAFVYRLDQAYLLMSDYLFKSHQASFVQEIRNYMRGLELQIGAATGIQVGGSRSRKTNKSPKKTLFKFKRFELVGPKKAFF